MRNRKNYLLSAVALSALVLASAEAQAGGFGIREQSAVGAGDAFAAGMLYGLHEQWPIVECLQLGHACAAASMRAVSTTAGVGTIAECLKLAKQWGFRPLTLNA